MEDFEDFMRNTLKLANSSIRVKKSQFNTLLHNIQDENKLLDEDKMINMIVNNKLVDKKGNTIDKTNTKTNLIKVLINYYKYRGNNHEKLSLTMDKLNEKSRTEPSKKQAEIKATLTKNYITDKLKEIDDTMTKAFENDNYNSFLILWFMMNLYVRNKDLNAVFITRKKDITEDDNYILLKPTHILFVRNDYKTADTYGTKEHKIKDLKVIFAVRMLYNKGIRHLLFNQRNTSERVGEASIGQYIRNILKSLNIDDVMGQGFINKLNTTKALEDVDYKKFKNISKKRGTDKNTLLSSYNLGK